jgi:rhamnulokinase
VTGAVHVAFDLGAESGRAIVARWDGDRLALEEAHRFPNRCVRLPDGLYWDALGLYAELVEGLGRVVASGAEVRSVGVDGWAIDYGLLDESGALVGNPRSYRDPRFAAVVEEAYARVPAEEVYAVTGIQTLPFNTLFQLLDDERLRGAATMLLLPDLLAHWLTGTARAEATNASTTQLLDARSGRWSEELIARFDLPRGLFPELVEAGTPAGGLLPHVAAATGLPAGTPVVAVASHDTASAVAGTPLGPRSAFLSSGTWSLVGVELPGPVLTPAAHEAGLANERGLGGTTRLLKNVMGLWLLQECRREWLRAGAAPSYAELAELAGAVPAGALFDPDRPELLAPGAMTARIRAACGADGPTERPAVVRAIFDSLACRYRWVIEQLERVTGTPVETIHVVGGGSENAVLCRLTADVTRRPVVAGPVEAAAAGNALVQAAALGELAAGDIREVVRRSFAPTVYEPGPDGDAAEELYGRFLSILDAEVLTR